MKNATPLVSMVGVLILAFLLDRAVGSIHSQPALWLEAAGRILAAAAVLWLASVAFGRGAPGRGVSAVLLIVGACIVLAPPIASMGWFRSPAWLLDASSAPSGLFAWTGAGIVVMGLAGLLTSRRRGW